MRRALVILLLVGLAGCGPKPATDNPIYTLRVGHARHYLATFDATVPPDNRKRCERVKAKMHRLKPAELYECIAG